MSEVSYEAVNAEFKRLAEENERLAAENAQLRQQIRDITCHPQGTYKGPILWCDRCGAPVAGRMIDHKCCY
jgi:hypothetical protein